MQATVPSRSWVSVRDVAHFPAQSRNQVHGSHVAVRTVCDEQWALNFTSSTRVLGHVLSMNMGMQFVGLRFLVPMLIGFRPLRTVLLLSLIMAFVSWSCFATVTDVSQMLWLSLLTPANAAFSPLSVQASRTLLERRPTEIRSQLSASWSRLLQLWAIRGVQGVQLN